MDKRFTNLWSAVCYAISCLWYLLDTVLIEPLAFAFAILLLLTRLQIGVEQSDSLQEFWQWVGGDMLEHPLTYGVFFGLFTLWIIFKLFRLRSENTERNKVITTLEHINKVLDRIEMKLNNSEDNDDRNKPKQ